VIRSSAFERLSTPLLRQARWGQFPVWPLGLALLGHLLLLLPLTVSLHGLVGLALLAAVPGWLLALILFPTERSLPERIPLAYALGLAFMMMLTLGLHVLPGPLTPSLLLGVADVVTLGLAVVVWRREARGGSQQLSADPPKLLPARLWLIRWLPVILLLIFASGLRLVELGYSEFQGDEARATLLAAGVAEGDDGILLVHQKAPGEVLLPSASYALVGGLNEFTARLPFALAGIVALLMAYSLGRRMMAALPNGERYGHLAGLLVLATLTVSAYLVAFGRLLQYQSVVLLFHLSALWLCWRFYEDGPARGERGVATWQPNLVVAAILCGVGILAHYEGILVAPVLLLLFVLAAQRHQLSLGEQVRTLLPPALLFVAVPACFYVPFVQSPSFAVTSEYVLRRVSKKGGVGILYNNVPFYVNISAFYHTIYQLVALIGVLLAALVAWLLAYVRPRPLAWGLAALMRGGTLDRPRQKLACLLRIAAAAELEEGRRLLLVNCVESYLELTAEEAAEFAALCAVRENREAKAMATSWADRLEAKGREVGLREGLQEGRHEGRQEGRREGLREGLRAMQEMLLSLLEQRFGPLPEATRERVEAISSLERLTRLGRRVLTARSLASLRLG